MEEKKGGDKVSVRGEREHEKKEGGRGIKRIGDRGGLKVTVIWIY